jgi:hypothetical protein
MIKNSPSRISKRRKVALFARENNLRAYNGLLSVGGHTDEARKFIERKIALTESEIVILKKATGTL